MTFWWNNWWMSVSLARMCTLTYLYRCVCSTVMHGPVQLLVTILVTVDLQSLVLVLVYNIDSIWMWIMHLCNCAHSAYIVLSSPWMSWQSFCDESCFHVKLGLFFLDNGIFFKWQYLCIVFFSRLNDYEWLATYKEYSWNILPPSKSFPSYIIPSLLIDHDQFNALL